MHAPDTPNPTSPPVDPSGHTTNEPASEARNFNWALLVQFNRYRFLLVAALLALTLIPAESLLNLSQPVAFFGAALAYTLMALGAGLVIHRRSLSFENIASILAFGDILLIILLMHATGGPGGGFGLLLLIAIGECAVLLPRRLTIFFASFGTLAALIEHSWELLTRQPVDVSMLAKGYPGAGLLGLALFATATLGNTLATRQRQAAALAERRGLALSNLAHVNEIIIDQMQSGVIVCDPEGRIETLNRAALRLLDADEEDIHGESLAQVAAPLAHNLQHWAMNPERHNTQAISLDSGNEVISHYTVLGETGTRIGYMIFLEDTENLRHHAQQLKMEALARLTSSIAHEIRNPLSAISSAAQLMRETEPNHEDQSRLLEIIENHSRRMDTIIENITQLGRRDRTTRERIRLQHWLMEFLQHFTQSIDAPPEALSLEIQSSGLMACLDPDQLFQIVANLCQNALHFSPPDVGVPQVVLAAHTDEEGRPILDIMDRGPGVTPEHVAAIFDPFYTTSVLGTGLGLYISRELAEANGAQLSYLARDGGGSIFRLQLAPETECD